MRPHHRGLDADGVAHRQQQDPGGEEREFCNSSSTAGSKKKFKMTVDDSGTVSATEVTE